MITATTFDCVSSNAVFGTCSRTRAASNAFITVCRKAILRSCITGGASFTGVRHWSLFSS